MPYRVELPQPIPFVVSVAAILVDNLDTGELLDEKSDITINFRAERAASIKPVGAGVSLRAEGALRGSVSVTRDEIRAALQAGESTDNRAQAFIAVQRAALGKILAALPALKTAMENAT